MASLEGQLMDDIEQDDRMITVWVVMMIYPELTIRDVFEILEDFLLLETLLIEMRSIPNRSIEGPHSN